MSDNANQVDATGPSLGQPNTYHGKQVQPGPDMSNTVRATSAAVTAAQYLKLESIISGLSNALFNGVIAWLMLSGKPDRTWFGSTSFAADLVITGFLLPTIVALIVIPLQRKKVDKGKARGLALRDHSFLMALSNRLPETLIRSSIAFGVIGAFIIAPLTLAVFWLSGVQSVEATHYIGFKALWTGLLAAVMVLPIVTYALNGPGSSAYAGSK